MTPIQRTYLLLVGCILIVSHSSPVQAELVGYWPMDEGMGTTVADQSGNDLTGYFVGEILPQWIDGQEGYGKALTFNLDSPEADEKAAHVRIPDESDVIDEPRNPNIEKLRFTTDDSFTRWLGCTYQTSRA